jgi:hypothetical protein
MLMMGSCGAGLRGAIVGRDVARHDESQASGVPVGSARSRPCVTGPRTTHGTRHARLLVYPSLEIIMSTSNPKQAPIRKFIDVQKALKGASYPAAKDALLKTARQNDADEDVMEALAALPDDAFESPAAVSKAVGNESD